MRKFFSVLLCIILVISICICSSVSSSAIIVDSALIASIGISLAASVLLSIGIAAVSDSESQYVQFAEACGQLVWEQMLQDYTQAEILAMITIENGKAYFRAPSSLYNRLKSFILNYAWNELHINANITDYSGLVLNRQSTYTLSDIAGHYAIGVPSQIINYETPTYSVTYTPSNSKLSLILNDGSIFSVPCSIWSNVQSLVVLPVDTYGQVRLFSGGRVSNGSTVNAYPDNATKTWTTFGTINLSNNLSFGYQGSNSTFSYTTANGVNSFKVNGETICVTSTSVNDYFIRSLLAGTLLSNVSNNLTDVNSNSSVSTYDVPVETEVLSPSLHGNVGSEQSVLVPIPSTFEDPSLPGVPLPQRTVKNRIKRGQEVALVPDLPSLKDKTPQDLGVLVVNNTDIQDTVISPSLSTTHYGDSSTTFVILPDNPGSTPIPEDINSPLVSSPYPDVINPGSETITVTANDDIFPTANNPPATTVRPSVSVSNPDEVASSAASEIVEGVSDIVKEGVSDLATPLTPGEIEKGANRMRLAPQLLSKFPFCIPFDFYNSINQLAAPSEVPQFDIPFQIQSINFNHTFHIDLTNFETAAKISRWFFSVAWIVTLIFLTRKVIWK